MVTKTQHLIAIREAGKSIGHMHQKAMIHFAEQLRLMDEERRISLDLGVNSVVGWEVYQYFNAVYRVLSFGKPDQIMPLLIGSPDEIDAVIRPIVTAGGFETENGFWMEIV